MIVRHLNEMHSEDRPNMRDGQGTVTVTDALNPDEFHGKGRLFAQLTIPVGASIGLHQHVDETEFYIIQAGQGVYSMDDQEFEVGPGDLTVVPDGHRHGIRNSGDEPLKMIALILFTGDRTA